MLRDNYFNSENAKELEKRLAMRMSTKGFTPEEVLRIITQRKVPRTDMCNLLLRCVTTIDDYVSMHGALCKGEFKHIGGKILGIKHSKFNEYLLDRTIINPDNEAVDLTSLLKRKRITYKPLSDFLKHTDTNIIRYGSITEYNSMVWHRDWNNALEYVNAFLVRRDPQKSKQLSVNFNSSNTNNTANLNITEERVLTKEEFATKYEVSDQDYIAQSPIEFSDAERTLLIKGIYETDNIRVVLRMIRRNDDFLRMMSVPDKTKLSYEKIKKMVITYSSRVNGDREEFWKDIESAFGVKKFA